MSKKQHPRFNSERRLVLVFNKQGLSVHCHIFATWQSCLICLRVVEIPCGRFFVKDQIIWTRLISCNNLLYICKCTTTWETQFPLSKYYENELCIGMNKVFLDPCHLQCSHKSSWTGHSKSPSVNGEHGLIAIPIKYFTPHPFMAIDSSLAEDMPPLINENHCHTINIPNHEHELGRTMNWATKIHPSVRGVRFGCMCHKTYWHANLPMGVPYCAMCQLIPQDVVGDPIGNTLRSYKQNSNRECTNYVKQACDHGKSNGTRQLMHASMLWIMAHHGFFDYFHHTREGGGGQYVKLQGEWVLNGHL